MTFVGASAFALGVVFGLIAVGGLAAIANVWPVRLAGAFLAVFALYVTASAAALLAIAGASAGVGVGDIVIVGGVIGAAVGWWAKNRIAV